MKKWSIFAHKKLLLAGVVVVLTGCGDKPSNNPHADKDTTANVLFSSFTQQPKTLDPARSYNQNEAVFTAQIYEPPLQYHYLKRPYQLVPLTAQQVPRPKYYDKNNKRLPQNAQSKDIAYSVYDIDIQPGRYYQPHPAFAKAADGGYRYHQLAEDELAKIYTLNDFQHQASRELLADDYVYQIKRLAHPKLQSPIMGFMSDYIVGLPAYHKTLTTAYEKQGDSGYLDLRDYPLAGVQVISPYRYRIKINGKYPQFLYWLAMPFFSPIPWEADVFYAQLGLAKKNISFDWYPVGTGAYMLTENNPNRQMVLSKNPNFYGENYPTQGAEGDAEMGLLDDAGLPLPFIDKVIFSLEKESIPRWTKFLQGYYDYSGISSDSFDQAIQVGVDGEPYLTPEMAEKGISLQHSVGATTFYAGFNMLDDVVGGNSERARLLRQAISIAVDYEEFIMIFLNGRGIPAQGPLPPGIFGFVDGKAGMNQLIYEWVDGKPQRKPIEEAKKLLAKAGYPNGIDSKTQQPLILNYDITISGGPDDSARLAWMRKQFDKLGIQLNIRATQYNRFQEKMRNGNAQIFLWGWSADYPDPENFLFLLYGPNSRALHGGENAANYQNPEYDRLFDQMEHMPNGPERQKIINQLVEIVNHDAPWIWGFHPKNFMLYHDWNYPIKTNDMANNTLKYKRIDTLKRTEKQQRWNQPIIWPLAIIGLLFVIILIPVSIRYWKKEHRAKELS